jgi:hypothetical protein
VGRRVRIEPLPVELVERRTGLELSPTSQLTNRFGEGPVDPFHPMCQLRQKRRPVDPSLARGKRDGTRDSYGPGAATAIGMGDAARCQRQMHQIFSIPS